MAPWDETGTPSRTLALPPSLISLGLCDLDFFTCNSNPCDVVFKPPLISAVCGLTSLSIYTRLMKDLHDASLLFPQLKDLTFWACAAPAEGRVTHLSLPLKWNFPTLQTLRFRPGVCTKDSYLSILRFCQKYGAGLRVLDFGAYSDVPSASKFWRIIPSTMHMDRRTIARCRVLPRAQACRFEDQPWKLHARSQSFKAIREDRRHCGFHLCQRLARTCQPGTRSTFFPPRLSMEDGSLLGLATFEGDPQPPTSPLCAGPLDGAVPYLRLPWRRVHSETRHVHPYTRAGLPVHRNLAGLMLRLCGSRS